MLRRHCGKAARRRFGEDEEALSTGCNPARRFPKTVPAMLEAMANE